MAEGFTIATFKHVADGLQEGQFAVGERRRATSLDDLDPNLPGTARPADHGHPRGRRPGRPPGSHPDVVRPRRREDPRQHRRPPVEVRVDPEETAAHRPRRQSRQPVSLGKHQVHGRQRGFGGRTGRGAGHGPARPDLDETRERSRHTACVIPPSTRGECCSSAGSIESRPSASPDPGRTGPRRPPGGANQRGPARHAREEPPRRAPRGRSLPSRPSTGGPRKCGAVRVGRTV